MKTLKTQTNLINWLKKAQHYPHPVTQVKLIQTHISCVFLTGEYAYKLKKAVCFEFLDFSTPEQRRHFCELEIQLNRRTANDLYLDVVNVYRHNVKDEFSLASSCADQTDWQVVDYLVKMRQFDPSQVLSQQINQAPLTLDTVTELSKRIAKFHRQAEVIAPPSFWGSAECVLQPMLANFPSLQNLFERLTAEQQQSPSNLTRLDLLKQHTQTQHTLVAPLLAQRQQQGFVRACHGDLHLDNITYYQDQLVLFDGIEFNEQFRLIDVVSDLAFLLTDLDANNGKLSSQQLLNYYLIETGDYEGLGIVNFYQTYRAMVRAKISGLRYEQLMPGSAEATSVLDQTLAYINLAESYAFPSTKPPKILIMQGISGSGKSFLAQKLADLTGAIWINSDRERKRWFGIRATERVSGQAQSQLYSSEANQATYQRLYEACAAALQAGRDVIVDATFLAKISRQRFYSLATRHQADCATLVLIPNPALAKQRITERLAKQQDPSDATIEVMQRQIAHFEAPEPDELAFVFEEVNPMESSNWRHLLNWFSRECPRSLLE